VTTSFPSTGLDNCSIYQHEARGADKRITEAIDFHLQAEYSHGNDDDGAAGALVPAG
jgi:hypothetical protein